MRACVHVYIYICLCVCIYMHVYVCACIHIVYMYTCIYTFVYKPNKPYIIHMFIYTHGYTGTYIYCVGGCLKAGWGTGAAMTSSDGANSGTDAPHVSCMYMYMYVYVYTVTPVAVRSNLLRQ